MRKRRAVLDPPDGSSQWIADRKGAPITRDAPQLFQKQGNRQQLDRPGCETRLAVLRDHAGLPDRRSSQGCLRIVSTGEFLGGEDAL